MPVRFVAKPSALNGEVPFGVPRSRGSRPPEVRNSELFWQRTGQAGFFEPSSRRLILAKRCFHPQRRIYTSFTIFHGIAHTRLMAAWLYPSMKLLLPASVRVLSSPPLPRQSETKNNNTNNRTKTKP